MNFHERFHVSNTLYVRSGQAAIDMSALEDLFATVGDVQQTSTETVLQLGNPRGFGVFVMSSEQQALDCVERFHGQSIMGQVHSIAVHRPVATAAALPKAPKRRAR